MTVWLDAHLSPGTARWLGERFGVEAFALRDLGLRDASDEEIFTAARKAGAAVLTKDSDFVRLLDREGSPPKVIWLTCGNTSEAALRDLLGRHFERALELLGGGEDLVEIGSRSGG